MPSVKQLNDSAMSWLARSLFSAKRSLNCRNVRKIPKEMIMQIFIAISMNIFWLLYNIITIACVSCRLSIYQTINSGSVYCVVGGMIMHMQFRYCYIIVPLVRDNREARKRCAHKPITHLIICQI